MFATLLKYSFPSATSYIISLIIWITSKINVNRGIQVIKRSERLFWYISSLLTDQCRSITDTRKALKIPKSIIATGYANFCQSTSIKFLISSVLKTSFFSQRRIAFLSNTLSLVKRSGILKMLLFVSISIAGFDSFFFFSPCSTSWMCSSYLFYADLAYLISLSAML